MFRYLFNKLFPKVFFSGNSGPSIGVFSVVAGKRGKFSNFNTRATTLKCAGECTCRCCK